MADRAPVDPIVAAVTDHYAYAFLHLQEDLLAHAQSRMPRFMRGAVTGLPDAVLRRFAREIACGITLALQMYTEQVIAALAEQRDAA